MSTPIKDLWNLTDNGYTSTIEGYDATLDFSAKTCLISKDQNIVKTLVLDYGVNKYNLSFLNFYEVPKTGISFSLQLTNNFDKDSEPVYDFVKQFIKAEVA